MNSKEFEAVVSRMDEQTMDLLLKKGREYAPGADRLANFKDEAKALGVTPLLIWAVYAKKHMTAVINYAKAVETEYGISSDRIHEGVRLEQAHKRASAYLSEPIDGRFADLINYCLLGVALIMEAEDRVPEVIEEEGGVAGLLTGGKEQ